MPVNPELNSELRTLTTNIVKSFIEISTYFHTNRFGTQVSVHLITSGLPSALLCPWHSFPFPFKSHNTPELILVFTVSLCKTHKQIFIHKKTFQTRK